MTIGANFQSQNNFQDSTISIDPSICRLAEAPLSPNMLNLEKTASHHLYFYNFKTHAQFQNWEDMKLGNRTTTNLRTSRNDSRNIEWLTLKNSCSSSKYFRNKKRNHKMMPEKKLSWNTSVFPGRNWYAENRLWETPVSHKHTLARFPV